MVRVSACRVGLLVGNVGYCGPVHLRRGEGCAELCAVNLVMCVCYTCVLCYADRTLDRQRFAVLHVSMGGVGLPCP
jgi:hypothetical protein